MQKKSHLALTIWHVTCDSCYQILVMGKFSNTIPHFSLVESRYPIPVLVMFWLICSLKCTILWFWNSLHSWNQYSILIVCHDEMGLLMLVYLTLQIVFSDKFCLHCSSQSRICQKLGVCYRPKVVWNSIGFRPACLHYIRHLSKQCYSFLSVTGLLHSPLPISLHTHLFPHNPQVTLSMMVIPWWQG